MQIKKYVEKANRTIFFRWNLFVFMEMFVNVCLLVWVIEKIYRSETFSESLNKQNETKMKCEISYKNILHNNNNNKTYSILNCDVGLLMLYPSNEHYMLSRTII